MSNQQLPVIEGFELPPNLDMAMKDQPPVTEESMSVNDEKVLLMCYYSISCVCRT